MSGAVAVTGSIVEARSVVIASGAALSGSVDLGGGKLVGIDVPASWTAANLTLQTSADGTDWFDAYEASGSEIVLTAAVSRHIVVPMAQTMGFRFLRVRSGTGGTPVNQGAARTLGLRVCP